MLGVLGAGLGVPAGIGFAAGLNAVFKTFGIDLPNTGTVIETRTIVVALAVGILVTLASALVPALRATRVTPMAALREAELPESRTRGRVFTAFAAAALPARHRDDVRRALRRHGRRQRRRGAGRAAARWPRSSASRCSARAWCARWRRSAAGRSRS